MNRTGTLVIVAILAATAGALGLRLWDSRDDPLAVGPMVTGFQRQNELTVFRAQVVSAATTRIDGWIDPLDQEQTAIIPAEVRYTVNLSRMRDSDVAWDAARRTMTVTVPPVLIQRPDLAEERGRYFSKGILIQPDTQQALTRSNSIKALREAVDLARNPELVRMAQDSARKAIGDNAQLYLRGAGRDNVQVVVRFATEGRRSPERWDRSRNLEQVRDGAFPANLTQ